MHTVYISLCQSVLCYCIPAWGGTYKTLFLKLERAQRYVLKVIHGKPRLYPTTDLYRESQVLTVRQLFVLRTILRRHSQLPLDSQILQKRRGALVCPPVQCRTSFASRQYDALSSRIYNNINNIISMYKLNKYNLKNKLTDWLKSLN